MSEPAARLRQPFDLDDFERRLRGTSTGPVSGAATSAGAVPSWPAFCRNWMPLDGFLLNSVTPSVKSTFAVRAASNSGFSSTAFS